MGLLRRASFKGKHVLVFCALVDVLNIAEFSPSSDGKYPSSTGSPLPNKTQSPVLLNNTGDYCVIVLMIICQLVAVVCEVLM